VYAEYVLRHELGDDGEVAGRRARTHEQHHIWMSQVAATNDILFYFLVKIIPKIFSTAP
jgi:hypothetical protein